MRDGDVTVAEASEAERPVLTNLLQLYLYDVTAFRLRDVGPI